MDDDSLDEREEEQVVIQKPKRTLNALQREVTAVNLAKGRAARSARYLEKKAQKDLEKQEVDLKKAEHKVRLQEIVAKKARKLAADQGKQEALLRQIVGEEDAETDGDNDYEVEERIFKKPKKKRIIFREESDSEEEVVVKKRPKTPVPASPASSVPPPCRAPAILFY